MNKLAIWSPRPDAKAIEPISSHITVYGLPVITIRSKPFDVKQLATTEALIFISHRAVKHFFEQAPTATVSSKTLIAIGQRTADALKHHGLTAHLTAPPPFNSEALLADKSFRNLPLQRFAIICGVGGRSLLQHALFAQGKTAIRIECYQRDKANLLPQRMVQFLNEYAIGGIILSSGEISEAVAAILTQTNVKQALHLPVFTLSERIALRAEQLGFRQIYSTEQASQYFLYQRIINWWEGELR